MKLPAFQFLCALLALALCDGTQGAEVVRTAAVLRAMSPSEASRALPVDIEVVALFVDHSRRMLFVHDGAFGFYANRDAALIHPDWLVAGRKLRLQGATHEGAFMPVVIVKELIDLGAGELPKVQIWNPSETMLSPAMDSQWVEVEGIMKQMEEVDGGLTLCLQVGEARLPLELPRNANFQTALKAPLYLLERRVKARVVAATLFNEQRQMSGRVLYLPSLDFLTLLEPTRTQANVPLRRVDELLLSTSPLNERVQVRGVVTYSLPGKMLFLRGEGGSLKVESALIPNFKPGTIVEAEGVVTFSPFRPRLTAATLKELVQSQPPAPLPLDYNSARRSSEQHELVTLDTTYVDTMQTSAGAQLVCRSGSVVFKVMLPSNMQHTLKLQPRMRLRLRGICELEIDNPFGITRVARVFSIILRSPEDLEILQTPPFWNTQRLLILLAVTGGGWLLFTAWAWLLRTKVAEQSAIIERQTATRATLDERQRIARDLHDTLEQELSGVAILLDTSLQQLETGDGGVNRSLGLARQLLRHSREESRTTICDLRSVVIEQMGLVGAMEATLRPLAESAGMVFNFVSTGEIRSLPGTVEAAFLRTAHEAVANAAKHSCGSCVKVVMAYQTNEVKLEIADDGTGFSPDSVADGTSGHFGLIGMRERALRISAILRVDGQGDVGTRISLIWRLLDVENPLSLTRASS